MKIADLINHLETVAPAHYQESWDNAGLLTGEPDRECTGILVTLDATEAVVKEAAEKNCNLIVAHHPILFSALKKITGKNYVEKTILRAIRQDIALFAIHTNLDNLLEGVNGTIADKLGLQNRRVLKPRASVLSKLFTFVPPAHIHAVREAVFSAGAGHIGNYSEVCFTVTGTGSYRPGEGTHPFAGEPGKNHNEAELKIEVLFPTYLRQRVIDALLRAHPYEEVAYDLVELSNTTDLVGSGLIGELPHPVEEEDFLVRLKDHFRAPVIRHSRRLGRPIKTCAVCGGAGSFLISNALASGADVFVTADLKYHEFFDANDRLLLADIGHFESEQFTIDLLADILRKKFPTFAVQKSTVATNPVHYFL